MPALKAKRILIAPLDWGLGHTTRCIPIIRRLLADKREVIFAGNDLQQTFVRTYFPDLEYQFLEGYNISYRSAGLMTGIIMQLPRLLRKIKEEHEWLLKLVETKKIDGIISDNRYGLWHSEIPCVILTHQAGIKTGLGQLADKLLLDIHYSFLQKFSSCWIVDTEGENNLAGSLSHPYRFPKNTRFIGWLSQFSYSQRSSAERYILILLSGPEPHRTILSDLLWEQACKLNQPFVFVEGAPTCVRKKIPDQIPHFTQLAGETLQEIIEQAEVVICRSGYSTLMDLVLLKKKAVIIPTPGQTEQEYLANTLSKRKIFFAAPQKNFSLIKTLEALKYFPFRLPVAEHEHQYFESVLNEWVENL